LWCLWAFGAVQLFWLAAIAIGLFWAIAIAERIVVHLLQQPASFGIFGQFKSDLLDELARLFKSES
ncbi:hypothetical protein ACC695_39130, partial [Rhizobium ruizarguesonis]